MQAGRVGFLPGLQLLIEHPAPSLPSLPECQTRHQEQYTLFKPLVLSLYQKIPSAAGIGNPFQCENSTLN